MLNNLWLQTFHTLVQTGHFTRTAEKLFMTQPGVTQHIQKLEQQIGCALILRQGRQFELTAAGEKIYEYAHAHRQIQKQLLEEIEVDDPHQGVCRFSCSGSLTLMLYPKFLTYQQQHKGLSIQVEAAPNKAIIDTLVERKIDMGIVTQDVYHPDIQSKAIGRQSLQLVLPAKWATQPVDVAALKQLGFIDHPDGQHYSEQVLQANFNDAFSHFSDLKINGYINQINQILVPVAMGLGFTVLPQSVVANFAQSHLLFIAPLKQPVEEPLYLIQRESRPLPSRFEWFQQCIEQSFSPA
ncbi:LysR family transcriptional regulator [Echinimonas agarilytica]|uniref:LysR family transcriptional regulator n=1 Tax=Echinimonas agarilytica TaxID=1215918 RepID=A0AA41W7A1_9GAMM|nr:LysR family transcriptional regulator [Echinimonas agarilytica]MCM2680517.1 LysR family transcriptional regulator [Echinimonas agarilytica]